MLNTHHLDPASDAIADRLSEDPDYKILRKLPEPFAQMPADGAPPQGLCLVLIDLETTGLYAETGAIIEIAIKLLWVSGDGELLAHYPIFSWLENPGHPLDSQIVRLTGLQHRHLLGKLIDDAAVARLLDRADLFIAHNASFDARWIEQRWPQLAGRRWACSCQEIDWLGHGFDGRNQQFLLQQHGWFSAAHRAVGDVWSLFWLLQQRRPDPTDQGDIAQSDNGNEAAPAMRTYLQRLLAASSQPSMKIEAIGIPFSKKTLLAQRGYRWDPGTRRRFWWRELNSAEVEAEQLWFQREGLPSPQLVPITSRERHR